MTLMLILFLPLLIPWVAKFIWHNKICWKEHLCILGIVLVIVGATYATGMHMQSSDVEIWSGYVTKKAKERVSCSHSYSCNCRTVGSGDSKHTVCDTCYDHSYDNDWTVYASYGGRLEIAREDRQGLTAPIRWKNVHVEDPMSTAYSFTNYVKGAPDSLFNGKQAFTEVQVPAYPSRIYDYYKIDRAITAGAKVPNLREWNDKLSLMLRRLGAQKKVNVVLVFAGTNDKMYVEDIRKEWLGAKKNDVVVVFGAKNYPVIEWGEVISWSENKIIHVDLRNRLEIFAGEPVNVDYTMAAIKESIVLNFEKMNMDKYEYLKDEIEPPLWATILSFVLGMLASIGAVIYFHKNDAFGTERKRRYGR